MVMVIRGQSQNRASTPMLQGSRFAGFCPRVMAVKPSYTSQCEELRKEKTFLDVLAHSPFIIRCFGDDITITDDNQQILNVFLEYASGGSLADLIDNSRCLGLREPQVRRYTKSILRGIHCIHEMGFVHCDLKPQNILLVKEYENDDDFVPKIADFGLSKRADNWISNTPSVGSPDYWAPECEIMKI
ncbi:Serine/threonine protein kinase [Parasponia andersonii]|uniref:Serine/threonine protein kinase n=1 Tax=Parasponia andersonii TaxID=3476 RepID=A0A2P5AAU8_PARAD|nr:Serine/threonine protein kinase [Parasponia andersonii]